MSTEAADNNLDLEKHLCMYTVEKAAPLLLEYLPNVLALLVLDYASIYQPEKGNRGPKFLVHDWQKSIQLAVQSDSQFIVLEQDDTMDDDVVYIIDTAFRQLHYWKRLNYKSYKDISILFNEGPPDEEEREPAAYYAYLYAKAYFDWIVKDEDLYCQRLIQCFEANKMYDDPTGVELKTCNERDLIILDFSLSSFTLHGFNLKNKKVIMFVDYGFKALDYMAKNAMPWLQYIEHIDTRGIITCIANPNYKKSESKMMEMD